jgi:hypothetical protein
VGIKGRRLGGGPRPWAVAILSFADATDQNRAQDEPSQEVHDCVCSHRRQKASREEHSDREDESDDGRPCDPKRALVRVQEAKSEGRHHGRRPGADREKLKSGEGITAVGELLPHTGGEREERKEAAFRARPRKELY